MTTTDIASPPVRIRPPRRLLRPTSRRYPFDELCSRIVDALADRGFSVPGVRVEFYDYGSGDQRLRCVGLVETDQARVVLHREQGYVEGGHYYDTAAASEIWVPGIYVRASGDAERSPLTGCTYDGSDWAKDRQAFEKQVVWPGEPWYEQRRRGRPSQGAVTEVCRHLRDVLLPLVESCPAPPADRPAATSADDEMEVPVPAWLREVYCWASRQDGLRIEVGRRDPLAIVAWERYGMTRRGYCLVPLGYADGTSLPAHAGDHFLWCGTRPPGSRAPRPGRQVRDTPLYDLVVPGEARSSSDCVVVVVRPRSAHEIYVADQASWDRRRAELARANPGRAQYTAAEIRDFYSARGRTLVPASEYRGDYDDPIVLVRRELGFDEVDVLPGQEALLDGGL